MKLPLASLLGLFLLMSISRADQPAPVYEMSQAESSSDSSSWLDSREKDKQACIKAVIRTTGNADVIVQKWESAEGKTALLLGVDEEREPWRCIVHKGRVEEVRRYE